MVEYEVAGDGAPYRVELRRSAPEWERSNYSGTDAEWQRNVVSSVGLLRRMYGASTPIPDAVIAAFNEWREGEHARAMSERAELSSGAADVSSTEPPAPVRGGVYEDGTGWIVTTGGEASAHA
jgi:hypothetical protein